MTRARNFADFAKMLLIAGFASVPSIASANPLVFDPVSATLPLFLETFFFAFSLKAFGFRPLPVFLTWFFVTSTTWYLLIGFPLGSFAAILAGSAFTTEEGGIIYLAAAIFLELGISLIETLILLLAARMRFFRRPDTANVQPFFGIVFKIAIIGNLVSMVSALPETLEHDYSCIFYLIIIPAIYLAKYLTRAVSGLNTAPKSDTSA